jgi:glycosyltransferase involved in cell wall biosynthesis
MNTFVVIPAWNEEKRIGQVLSDLSALPYRVVVVDDASQDGTYSVVSKYNVDLLKHKANRGQGAALQTGNDYALSRGADIIVHFDGDGQFLTEEIKDIIQPLLDGQADIVFGSRFLGKKSNMPWVKEKIYFPLARAVNRLLLGVKSSDPQSGFRAMTRDTAQRIQIINDEYAHCSEIIAKAFAYKLRIKEVPMTVIYRDFGQGFAGGLKILKDILFSKISK